jgi:hypothetical protein
MKRMIGARPKSRDCGFVLDYGVQYLSRVSDRPMYPGAPGDEWAPPVVPRDLRLSYADNSARLRSLLWPLVAMNDPLCSVDQADLRERLDQSDIVLAASGMVPGCPIDSPGWRSKTWNVPRKGKVVREVADIRRVVGIMLFHLSEPSRGPWRDATVCEMDAFFWNDTVDDEHVERWMFRAMKRLREVLEWDVLRMIVDRGDKKTQDFFWGEGFEIARTSKRRIEMVFAPGEFAGQWESVLQPS